MTLELSGSDLRRAIAHGLSLAAGCCQVSGIVARYDPKRPPEERLIDMSVGGKPLEAERTYRVSTNSFLAEGGDHYESFKNGRRVTDDVLLSDCVLDHLRRVGTISPPAAGRLLRDLSRPPSGDKVHLRLNLPSKTRPPPGGGRSAKRYGCWSSLVP